MALAPRPDPHRCRLSGADGLATAEQLATARAAGAGPVKAPPQRKVLWWSGGSLLLLVVLIAATVSWLLFTEPGARWVAATVTSRFAPQVKYASIDGTIAGELRITGFEFNGGADKARLSIAS